MVQQPGKGKSRLEVLEDNVLSLMETVETLTKDVEAIRKAVPKKGLFGGKREKVAILDTETNVVYPSKSAVGKALAESIDADPLDHFAWYKLMTAFPDRFQELTAEDPRAQASWTKQKAELEAEVAEANKRLAAEAAKPKK